MKPLVEKMLNSGLVDKATTKIMEQWGLLPDGSVDKTREDALKNATREHLLQLAEDLATEVEKTNSLRETSLELDKIRWPAEVSIMDEAGGYKVQWLQCVVDRMGRYYFRIQDVDKSWFIPGFTLARKIADGVMVTHVREMITESQVLFVNDVEVCVQVSTKKEA